MRVLVFRTISGSSLPATQFKDVEKHGKDFTEGERREDVGRFKRNITKLYNKMG